MTEVLLHEQPVDLGDAERIAEDTAVPQAAPHIASSILFSIIASSRNLSITGQ